ncbi:uncharacterized protein LOC124671888 [Lolium rigidum]|uniref:uncharacterized protein LOC124671888 n=1 Tax=Lolium rigidum TaxID=89674 RepID=UPI001F5C8850|nr:uncharacterized protein LOC124671888 [Lolium rigidum]
MDGTAGVASGGGDDGSCSDPEGVGYHPSTPRPTANPKYVCLRSLVGATSSSSNASREAMAPIARKVLDAGARLWVPVASDGSSSSDTDGGAGSPSSPASTLRKPLLRGPRPGAMGSTAAAGMPGSKSRPGTELAVTTNRDKKDSEYEKRQKTLDIITEDGENKDPEDQKRQKVVAEISNNVKDISVQSREIADCLKCLSSHVNQELVMVRDSREKEYMEDQERQKVVEQISSDMKDFAATSWVIAEHLESLSSCADEILQIKIEEREKRETEEKSQKEAANYLKECQSMLSDFVFFMLAFVPWILHKSEETPSPEYYCLTFSVGGLALFGMGGYVLSHLARRSKWIKAVYWITGIAVMATVLLVVYVLFELIPSSFKHMTAIFWVYLCLYLGVGVLLLVAWIRNFYQA